MNKSMLVGVVIGGASALSIGAVAGYQALKGPEFAEIMQVSAVHETVKTPETTCKQVQVSHKAAVKDENRIAGTVIGGVLGGVLGNQVGGGNGKKLATVAGLAGGAYAGNQVQKNMQEKDRTYTTEQRCKTITKSHDKVVGYDVQYRLDGKLAVVRMAQPPANNRIPVENGQLVLNQVVPTTTVPVVNN
ncbi:glycine zipper 2TM domain-containing protein [Chitinimonas arctica]|uniref:Glycine zipper 2TM domain-containing protein n=1 Tax=Chitinimonas arctica TaxID=2594795 RepID=A0A516SDD3_9NEIS|nr:glycine zipper 2TM domain-containing protein [Chitinimonas arctica]QDQ26048.1 glycine zipper 2TM domain-containing protein [Chitinimonas arctica]